MTKAGRSSALVMVPAKLDERKVALECTSQIEVDIINCDPVVRSGLMSF